MSLRKLAESIGEAPAVSGRSDSALLFNINSSFIRPLKVLLFSIAAQRTLLDSPIVIFTDDEAVKADSFLKGVSDRIELISVHDLKKFKNINASRIDNRVRLDWIPAYTFLNWFAFSSLGYSQHIFLDADMLCVGPLDHLTSWRERPLYGCPVFPKEMHSPGGERLGMEQSSNNISSFLADRTKWSSLNSGMMVINQQLLSESFREALIERATVKTFSSEQRVIQDEIDRAWGGVEMCSPIDNFHAGFLRFLLEPQREAVRANINLLHYVGVGGKPWKRQGANRAVDVEWMAAERRSLPFTGAS